MAGPDVIANRRTVIVERYAVAQTRAFLKRMGRRRRHPLRLDKEHVRGVRNAARVVTDFSGGNPIASIGQIGEASLSTEGQTLARIVPVI